MIRLEFTGTAREVIADMQSFLRLDPAMIPSAKMDDEETAKPDPKSRAKKSDAAPAAETGTDKEPPAKSAKEDASEKGATSSKAQSSAADDDVDVTNKDSVKAFLGRMITELGANIVQEALGEQGATKIGDLAPTKYPLVVERLRDLASRKDAE